MNAIRINLPGKPLAARAFLFVLVAASLRTAGTRSKLQVLVCCNRPTAYFAISQDQRNARRRTTDHKTCQDGFDGGGCVIETVPQVIDCCLLYTSDAADDM
jgi:hypothetical protein